MNKRRLQPGERIRVLVVDDSVVIRRLVTHALSQEPLLEVVGAAANGSIALQRIPQLSPDVLTLDIEMPEMDGLELLRHIRREYPHLRVIMFSTLTERGTAVTLEALSLGADDYVAKASNAGSLDRSLARLSDELVPKIKQFFELQNGREEPVSAVSATTPSAAPIPRVPVRPRIVAVGVSTGGPAALGTIIPRFPASFPLPIVIVQHMPPLFTRLLAERLQANSHLAVHEAGQGEPIEPGKILVAPGDFHLKVNHTDGVAHAKLEQSQPENSCRPAVDVLFRSVAETYGGAVVAAILTGMGQDGLRGAQVLKAQGATILAQDEDSSVVWGMPGAVVGAGLADRVLPLDRIVPEILRLAC